MKHLPNLLTLANLFCGCAAIAFILSAQNFTTVLNTMDYVEVPAIEQPYWGSIFIFAAAVFDMLDGLAARALKIFSPLGKDLDSLADVVSFGVAPAMIVYKLLWFAYMTKPEAMDVSLWSLSPAFLIACFAAWRLAKYNVTATEQKNYFIGLPVPAVGIFIAALPLIFWFNPLQLAGYLTEEWVIYTIIALLGWLMVSKIRFMKMMPTSWRIQIIWPQLLLLVAGVVMAIFLKSAAIPAVILLYILLSIIYKPKTIQQ